MRILRIKYPGGSIEYEVPILQIKDYDLYEIFEKRLFLLLPFYFFKYVDQLGRMEESGGLKMLESELNLMERLLQRQIEQGLINTAQKNYLKEMLKQVNNKLMFKHRKLREGVNKIMGGQIIWTEVDDILLRGRTQGKEVQLIELVCRKLKKGKTVEEIAEDLDEDETRIKVICDAASKYYPDYDIEKILADVMADEIV